MRPIYHYVDRRIRAHVAVCFLAYVMEMAIRQALGKNGVLSEKDYHAVMEDLRRLGVVEVTTRRDRYMMRPAHGGRAVEAFAAPGRGCRRRCSNALVPQIRHRSLPCRAGCSANKLGRGLRAYGQAGFREGAVKEQAGGSTVHGRRAVQGNVVRIEITVR